MYLLASYYYHSVRYPIRWLACRLIMSRQRDFTKIDILPRNEASKENVKSLGQYLTDTCEFTSALTQSIEPIIRNS